MDINVVLNIKLLLIRHEAKINLCPLDSLLIDFNKNCHILIFRRGSMCMMFQIWCAQFILLRGFLFFVFTVVLLQKIDRLLML